MKGIRVYANENGNISMPQLGYGQDGEGVWHVRPPECHAGSIPHHKVTEHEDGTITVHPSILLDDGQKKWHGWLKKGVWSK